MNNFSKHGFNMCSATAQLLLNCDFLMHNITLEVYRDMCIAKWHAYYVMSAMVLQEHVHEVPTTNGKRALLTDSNHSMWEAVTNWRKLHENATAYPSNLLETQRLLAVEDRAKFVFVDVWSRHVVLYQIHNSNTHSDRPLISSSYNEYALSLCGEFLPDLED